VTSGRLQVTETGGRAATTRHIPPKLALAVGMPSSVAPRGWQWAPLTELARLESGHTPSRRHPEYWGGSIPWLSIQDAKAHHGAYVYATLEQTNDLGIANSSARVLPKNTVCLSRTASVGYVVVMGRSMATSQDFVNWICSKSLDPNFLKYLLIAEGSDILRFASGAVHQTIYFPEAKAFHICYPSLPEQRRIVRILVEAFEGIATAKANAEKNLQNARVLFESYLQAAFASGGAAWKEERLGDLCSIARGGSPRPIQQFLTTASNGINWIKISDATASGKYIYKTNEKIIPEGAKRSRVVHPGDFLLSNSMSFGRPYILQTVGCIHDGWLVLSDYASHLDQDYLYYALGSQFVFQQFDSLAAGSTVRNLNIELAGRVKLPVPPLKQQVAIAQQFEIFSAETNRLAAIYQQKLTALEALKKSLLHQAFTGQL
jgi:type I restriction enzyme, S subunit